MQVVVESHTPKSQGHPWEEEKRRREVRERERRRILNKQKMYDYINDMLNI